MTESATGTMMPLTLAERRKDFVMEADLVQLLRSRRPWRQTAPIDLITCSLCLRIRRGSDWLDADRVIREIRSYELAALPNLHSGVCDSCAESIFARRNRAGEPVAA
jgi:hypothetical protein